MNAEAQLNALKRRLIRDEIARRNPLDVDAVEALIGQGFAIAQDGRIIAQNPEGGAQVGNGAGYTRDIGECLDDLVRQRPSLFRGNPSSGEGDHTAEKNPFAKGLHFNITHQMQIMRTDPQRAEHLQYLAGLRV